MGREYHLPLSFDSYEITWRQRAQETLASLTRPHNGYLMSRE